jgi:predicted nucleotidyltransferase
MTMTVEEIREAALPACREFNVNRLDVFGSTARGSAKMSSDVDLLVEFKDPSQSPAKRFFGLLHSLEDALGCEVDLVTVNGLKNPYFRRRVLEERLPIYEG